MAASAGEDGDEDLSHTKDSLHVSRYLLSDSNSQEFNIVFKALGEQRREDYNLKVSLGYVARPFLKKPKCNK